MTEISKNELGGFLSQGTFTAKLATVKEDGSPHVVPVWFVLDAEDNIIFGTETGSVKGKNILRDPRVSICVDYQEYPYSFVTIFGRAETFREYRESSGTEDKNIQEESKDFLHWMRKISERYVGSDKADKYAKRNTTEGAVLYRITPSRIASEKVIADW
ncbi:MAG TPA: PPOX class F420-dependent oxidoreductase [Nitrososphaeraceae archaeon]|nr:PPOX class F420-dependent oxidoreductase [Nitrososphaeraceae archaeon]